MNDNRVPLGVWIFWSVIGFILILSIFRWATGGNTPTYIAPIAACLSALASTASVYMATKTFYQNRKDRQEEIEAKHPRFAITKGIVVWITEVGGDHAISPFYELHITLKNVQEHSAKHLRLSGSILDKDGKSLHTFTRKPTDYIEKDGSFEVETRAPGIAESPDPYFVKLYLSYWHPWTGKKHAQTLWRKFYMQGEEGMSLPLLLVDTSELPPDLSKKSISDKNH